MIQDARDDDEYAGSIRLDELITITTLCQRLGIRPATVRSAVRQGLTARRLGRRTMFLGEDVARYLRSRPRVDHAGKIRRKRTATAK